MTKRLRKITALLASVLVVAGVFFTSAIIPSMNASAESAYSDVLTDLRKDENFKIADYPIVLDKYTVEIIQIAESTDGELFVYTYQPCQKLIPLKATAINMSLSGDYGEILTYDSEYGNDFIGHTGNVSDSSIIGGGIGGSSGGGGGGGGSRPCAMEVNTATSCNLYNLTLLSSTDVFCKYKVDNFIVKKDIVRYYNVVSILRKHDSIADGADASGEVPIKVGRCWTAHTVGDKVYYTNEAIQVVEIQNPLFGSVRYGEGFDWWKGTACDSHFVVFDTDWKIDRLLEADVSFKYRKYDKGMYGETTGDGWTPLKRTITYDERAYSNKSVFGGVKNRSWKRIQTGREFVQNCDVIDENVAQEISSRQWVLSYYETDYSDETGGVFGWLSWVANIFGYKYQHGTQVTGVSVLRLKFLSDGQVYDLGAVSNRSGDLNTIGGDYKDFGKRIEETWNAVVNFFTDKVRSFFVNMPWWGWLIIGVVAVGVIFGLVAWIAAKVRQRK